MAAALLTFVGLIATTVGSVYVGLYAAMPSLAPRESLGATIDHMAVESGVSYSEYRERMDYVSGITLSDETSIHAGVMVFVRVTLTGYVDRGYSMTIHTLDDQGHRISPDEIGIMLSSCEVVTPRANEDGVTWRCWSMTPQPGAVFRIRAELYDSGPVEDIMDLGPGRQQLLDFMETEQIAAS